LVVVRTVNEILLSLQAHARIETKRPDLQLATSALTETLTGHNFALSAPICLKLKICAVT